MANATVQVVAELETPAKEDVSIPAPASQVTQDTPDALSWKMPEPDWTLSAGCDCDDCVIARAVGWKPSNPEDTVYWYTPDMVKSKKPYSISDVPVEKPDMKSVFSYYTSTTSSTSTDSYYSSPAKPSKYKPPELTPEQIKQRDERAMREKSLQVKIDPYVAVSTLYVLCDIQARVHMAMSESDVGIRRAQVLSEYYDELQELIGWYGSWLGQSFFNYIVLTSAGESRYAPGRSNFILKNHEKLPVNKGGRTDVYRAIIDYEPFSVLNAIYPVFNCDWVGGGFGGRKWANIVKSGMMYRGVVDNVVHRIPYVVFVDHVADLSHNGGLYFNKGTIFMYPHERYLEMLDVKRKSSIFDFIRQHDVRLYELVEWDIKRAVQLNVLKFKEARNRYATLEFVDMPEVVPVPWGRWTMDGQVVENPKFAEYRKAQTKKITQSSYGTPKGVTEEIDGTKDTPTSSIHFNPPRK